MTSLHRSLAGAALGVVALGAATMLPTQQAHAGAFVHLFEWKWSDVAQECENFLGPKGFSAVQVSPPQEHIQGDEWWTRYQPVSYQLQSRSGDANEFANMVQRCNAVGVDIYVDAVINHTAAAGSGTGTAGSPYNSTSLDYPDYSSNDFHPHCDIQPEDYGNDAWRVRNCRLVGLPDLATGDEYVRNTLAGYLNHLTSLGVRGLRIDAAKHMEPSDIEAILLRVNDPLYVFQEVIDVGNEAVNVGEYTHISDVTEFRYSAAIGDVFRNQRLANLSQFGEAWGFMASDKAVVFTDNHDNQRGHGAGGSNILTYNDGSVYNLANVFMLAWPYGYPKVMSSFSFSDSDQGPPAQTVYQNGEANCGDAWVCEHRWDSIANMVEFRNVTDGSGVSDWWDNGNNQIAFNRSDRGFVAINREGSPLSRTFTTTLPDGEYRNIAGDGSCVSVQGGQVSLTVPPMEAAALHIGAACGTPPPPPPEESEDVVEVSFSCANGTTDWGQSVYVTGDSDELGNWSPADALKLEPDNYPTWEATLDMPADASIEWKCIKRSETSPNSQLVWQPRDNNLLETGAPGSTASTSGSF
ncbi:carbohydrate-binding module family 20 domain-containing protein [Halomonas sp. 18071143]|uniref:carbohydrate-binding module family 20 domain-containing protein n=1 Tax=Halomonas sp. 18071143 TaxID=2855441 RepID=UPI001C489C42|nr:carbohydrate-binding module family 20 domain-containing protein [Halomonas sp. 18071143]